MARQGEGSGIGTVLGVGAVLGVVVLLARSSRASSAQNAPASTAAVGRFPPLVERWRREVARRAGDLPIDALLEWMRIESGGDLCSVGTATEVGLFQLNFPGDAKYGATLEGLRAICQKSKQRGFDISQLSESELDMEVGAGIHKVAAARDQVRQVLGASGIHWPETSFDFGSAVKQIHATPGVITELVPKISRQGVPSSWSDLRQRVNTLPADQMSGVDQKGRSYGLRLLALSPSKHGLKNRLEDTLRNAEFVGRAWASSYA